MTQNSTVKQDVDIANDNAVATITRAFTMLLRFVCYDFASKD